MSSTNIGPLTTTFTPSSPTCTSIFFAKNPGAAWLANEQNGDSCMPPGFTREPQYFYSPGICPSGYIYACSVLPLTTDSVVGPTVATCCPSSYSCVNGRQTGALDEIYACYSTFPTPTILTIPSTFYDTSTVVGTIVYTANSGASIYAYGLAIARSGNDPVWSSTIYSTSTTTMPSVTLTITASHTPSITPSQPVIVSETGSESATGTAGAQKNTNLSEGAKIGIGIAAALGCLFLIGLGYLLSRWRYQKGATSQGEVVTESQMHGTGPGPGDRKPPLCEMPAQGDAPASQLYGNALESTQAQTPMYEMPARPY